MSDPIPVLVVSGFLGSGKTTLVRHLLADAQARGVRVAVVSNEFGELGIDAELLAEARDDYVELSGGCVCCKLSDELVETLEQLRRDVDPERIVIETSGVALPFDTQLHFWRDPLRSWVADDVAVVVVNAEQLASERDLDDTFAQQVSSADLLVLNQVDRVPGVPREALEEKLRAFEPEAPLLLTSHGRVAPDLLFPPDPEGQRAARRARGAEAPPHDHERFETREVAFPEGVAAGDVLARLRAEGALRAKGFVATADGLRLVQGVGERIELGESERVPPPAMVGRVVVIGRPRDGAAS